MPFKASHIVLVVLISFGLKLCYLTFSYVLDENGWGHTVHDQYLFTIKKNDAFWYEKVVQEGYPKLNQKDAIGFSEDGVVVQTTWAFFPAYPMLISATMHLFELSFDQAAMLWSLILSTLAFVLFYILSSHFFNDPKKGFFATLTLLFYPFSFYYSMMYTEALFLVLLLCAFYAVLKQKLFHLLWILPILVLTRATGLVMFGILFIFLLEQYKVIESYHIHWQKLWSPQVRKATLYFSTGGIAFAAFLFFNYSQTGYLNAFSIAQAGWGRNISIPFTALFNSGSLSAQVNSILTIILLVLTFTFRKYLSLSMLLFLLIAVLLPMSTGSIGSMGRFSALMLPFFWYIFPRLKSNVSKSVLLVVFFLGQMTVFYFWTTWHPLGY